MIRLLRGTKTVGKSVFRKEQEGKESSSGAGYSLHGTSLIQSPVQKEEKEEPQQALKEHSPKTTVLEEGSKSICELEDLRPTWVLGNIAKPYFSHQSLNQSISK